jgi:hypothetical protein
MRGQKKGVRAGKRVDETSVAADKTGRFFRDDPEGSESL